MLNTVLMIRIIIYRLAKSYFLNVFKNVLLVTIILVWYRKVAETKNSITYTNLNTIRIQR